MIVALYILIALVVVGAVLKLTHKPDEPVARPADDGCCGRHAVCERVADSMMSGKPEYFDDEELDAFAGRAASDYSSDEIEIFRDVMFTLLPGDVAPWDNSLRMRGIQLPDELHDELLILLSDASAPSTTLVADA